ncbi:MAG: helix-turn-helix transcriptional regulator [Candidatus Pacearchaeota archaeon]
MKTRIKEFRTKHGFTQEELAKKVGVRRETIVFLEKGKYNPSLFLAFKIAKILHTQIEHLFIIEEEDNKEIYETSHEHHKRSYIP